MADIKIDSLALDSLIIDLQKDNEAVYTIIKNINDAYRTLDKNRWKSKEKDRMDEKINSYMQKLDNQILSYLNDCTNLLKIASNTYQETDLKNKKNIEEISNSISIDIV